VDKLIKNSIVKNTEYNGMNTEILSIACFIIGAKI